MKLSFKAVFFMRRTVFAATAATLVSCTFLTPAADAKVPGTVHCYNDICHRIRTAAETEARRGIIEPVVASFYDSPENDRFNPRNETSSGAQFDADAPDNAASPIHPDGTVLLVWSPVTGGAAIIRINNAGPYYPGRTLDVSRGVAERIGFSRGGVMQLLSLVIAAPSEAESRYVRGRAYPRVRGYLGNFENLALASLEEPAAREALFRGNTPLPALALSTPQQLMLAATTPHFKTIELALAFQAAPAEMIEPTEMLSGSSSTQIALAAPNDTIPSLMTRVANLTRSVPVIVRTVMLAALPPPLAIAHEIVRPVRAPKRAEPAPPATPRVRPAKVRDEAVPTRLTRTGKVWFDDDVQADR